MTTLEEQIRKQVEFYFSDSNYPRDKFLRGQAELSALGYVSLEIVASFARMKKLTADLNVVIKALKNYKSPVIELSEDDKNIRRINPLPEEDTITKKSIYAKIFPPDYTLEQVQQFFQAYGHVASVRLRRNLNRQFKGSVFVEFNTIEEAKKASELKLKFDNVDLIIMMKQDYLNLKKEQLQQRRENKKDGEEPEVVISPGTIMKFTGIGDNQTRETLKTLFAPYGDISYVDFTKNLNEGFVRFGNAEICTKAFAAVTNSKMQIGDKLPTYAIITGDEEKQYWQKVKKAKNNKFQNTKKGKGKGKFKGKGKANNKDNKPKVKGEKRKREEPENDETKKSKKVKVE